MPISSQNDQRSFYVFSDQHGRDWGAVIEIKSKGMVGGYHPQGWMAPFIAWMPPQRYIEQRDPKVKFMDLTVNYDAWVNDLVIAHREYQQLLHQCVTTVPGAALNAEGTPNPIALGICGPPPMALEPIYAMQQDNAFALGFEDTVDERLRPYFPVLRMENQRTVPDFSGPPRVVVEKTLAGFKCGECGRVIKTAPALKMHMRTHKPATVEG